MKEATSDLTNAIVVVLAVSILIAIFYYSIWPIIRENFNSVSRCSKAICESCPTNDCSTVTCHAKGDKSQTFECVYKG